MRILHEHLAQSALVVADVTKRDGSDHVAIGKRYPEATRARLIEVRDIQKVGLIFGAYVEAKLVALNGEYEVE